MYASRAANRRSEGTGEQRHTPFGQNQDQVRTRSFPSGGYQPQHTGFERRLKAYQEQARSQEWFHQPPQGPWLSIPHPYFYNQQDPSFLLNNRQNSCLRQHASSQAISHQQELPQYPYLFPQVKYQVDQMKQDIQESRVKPKKVENQSQTLEEESKNFLESQTAS